MCREILKNFQDEIVLIKGCPGANTVSYRHDREIWNNCTFLSADYQDYNRLDFLKLKQTLRDTDSREIDHLWIPYDCFLYQYLPSEYKQNPDEFYAVGLVQEYTRKKDGSTDLAIAPISLPEMLDVAAQYFLIPDLMKLFLYLNKKLPNPESILWQRKDKTIELSTHFLRQYPSPNLTRQMIAHVTLVSLQKIHELSQKFESKAKKKARFNSKRSRGFGNNLAAA